MSEHRTNVLSLVLAGGSGTRLGRLTAWRSKPALPFGAQFRTIDFPLSNCINSGLRQIAVLTQYKSQSLIRHLTAGWGFLHRELGEYIDVWPAQQRLGERWYLGNADAVHQNLDLIAAADPEYVLVLSGTQIYSMDYSLMLEEHIAATADLTVATVDAHEDDGGQQTFVSLDRQHGVCDVLERAAVESSVLSGSARAVMGVYLFNARFLIECLTADAGDTSSLHDFAIDVLPAATARGRVHAFEFRDRYGLPAYWRDLCTVDSYWRAHMDLLDEPPKFNVFDPQWPVWSQHPAAAPVRVPGGAHIEAAILGRGCTVAGQIRRSSVGAGCNVGARTFITDSVLLPDVRVGEGCILNHVVIDRGCEIPDNTVIGPNVAGGSDQVLSPDGVVLISRARSGRRVRVRQHAKVA